MDEGNFHDKSVPTLVAKPKGNGIIDFVVSQVDALFMDEGLDDQGVIVVDPPLDSEETQLFLSVHGKTSAEFIEQIIGTISVFQRRYAEKVRKILVRSQGMLLHVIVGLDEGEYDDDLSVDVTNLNLEIEDKGWPVQALEFNSSDLAVLTDFSDTCMPSEGDELFEAEMDMMREEEEAAVQRQESIHVAYNIQEVLGKYL